MPEAGDEAVPAAAGQAFPWGSAGVTRGGPATGGGKPVAPARKEARGPAAASAGEAAGDDQFRARRAAEVLADRLAMTLVHHEPGWRLPRPSVLARRFNVSTSQIGAAVSELIGRGLVRRLPDGQVHRVSPAEYLIPLEGVPGLRSRIDPMAGDLTCRSRQISRRRVPEDISWALHVDPAEPMCVVQVIWAAGGGPAAYATTYMPADLAGSFPGTAPPDAGEAEDPAPAETAGEPAGIPPAGEAGEPAGAALSPLPLTSRPELPGAQGSGLAAVGRPAALHVEMQLPPPSIARSLRLSAGQPAAKVAVRFDDPATGRPAALTIAMLRLELFRIVVQTAEAPLPGGEGGDSSGAWARLAEGWGS